ncbi:MAG: hypothetical protein ACRETK_00905 [Steroidobacteraceae bacterium]
MARPVAVGLAERGEHTLSFQYDHGCPTRAILLAIAKEWRVVRAESCVDDVVQRGTQATVQGVRVGGASINGQDGGEC